VRDTRDMQILLYGDCGRVSKQTHPALPSRHLLCLECLGKTSQGKNAVPAPPSFARPESATCECRLSAHACDGKNMEKVVSRNASAS